MSTRPLDSMVGRLDRLLSEFLVAVKSVEIDEADWQTLKHHAHDLVGVGNAALTHLKSEKSRARVCNFGKKLRAYNGVAP